MFRAKHYLPFMLAVAMAVCAVVAFQQTATHANDEPRPDLQQAKEYARGLSYAFQHVADQLEPSVVSIKSVREVPRPQLGFGRSPFSFGDDFFDRFFRFEIPQGPHEQQGIGTGVIVRDDGYILTNNHVVRDADTVEVKLYNGETYKAEIVGTDEKTDLAVLRIDADDLRPAAMGDSDKLDVGEWVVAMGDPFGLSRTVTAGIVSAKGRANVGLADYEDFIQTDAAINPGNSGGPLVDLDGNMVGINTAIVSRSGGFMGVGFAIPINMAQSVMNSLIDDGKVERGWLGVAIQDLNPDLSSSFGFDGTDGVLVGDVTPDGPADKAGLKTGDIITRFNGKPTTSMNQLRNMVAATSPGTKVELELYRDGAKDELKVKVGQLSASAKLAGGSVLSDDLGLSVKPVTPSFSAQSGYNDEGGVVVTNVETGSMAALAGLRPNDVIVQVGSRKIANLEDFRTALNEYDLKKGLRLRVWTEGMHRFVFLKSG